MTIFILSMLYGYKVSIFLLPHSALKIHKKITSITSYNAKIQ